MPYHMRGSGDRWCVYKGTRDDPGAELKCYTGSNAKSRARKYLAALYMNVEDAQTKKELSKTGVLKAYGEIGSSTAHDRWIAVSTVTMWDREDEMMTVAAIDKDMARAERTGEYPELRLWHVRGFKLGMCDMMTRVEQYAVDYGYWFDNPLANAMKDQVMRNDGKWRISRGFLPVKAAGVCPSCGAHLLVGPVHFLVGVRCPQCDTAQPKPMMLSKLKHLETVTYDISVTDVPIVPATAITAYLVES